MSRDAAISLKWADGTYRFRLSIGQIRELQEKVDAGPAWVLDRIRTGGWRVDDLRETIRLGLIGGGAKPGDALKLVERYVDTQPLADSVAPAMVILSAALFGAPDGERPGKRKAAERQAKSPSTESSASPPSTELDPS
ncbi:MAG: gene transfer agent family protein [Pseudomonadota bacterium]